MRSSPTAWILPLALFSCLSFALEIPIKRVSRRGASFRTATFTTSGVLDAAASTGAVENISTDDDLIYIANITIGGTDFPVQLDTGSSDLWVKPTTSLSTAQSSNILLNLTYGIGYAYGMVSQADVSFAGFDIPTQAFVDSSSANNPVFSYGAVGIVGLGFTSLSQVDMAVNETQGAWGRSLLYNAFAKEPTQPNFISFALERSEDPSNVVEGSFTIGEYDPKYTAIQNTPQIATVPPVEPRRWTIPLDAFEVGGTNYTGFTSVVTGAPSGKSIVLLDSGTSYAYVSSTMAQAIYGNIAGAQYQTTQEIWSLPCDAQVQVAFWFAGQRFPVHPLDSNRMQSTGDCFGTFLPQDLGVGGSDYDLLFGDAFLRNAYSLYDFGDTDANGTPTTGPYVQLLSITDENAALQDFVAVRGGTVPASVSNDNVTTIDGPTSAIPGVPAPSSTGVTTDDDAVLGSVNKLLSYAPILLVLLAINAIVLVLLLAVGVWLALRRNKRSGAPGASLQAGGNAVYQPVELRSGTRESVFNSQAPYSQEDLTHKRTGTLDTPISPMHKSSKESMLGSRSSRLVRASMLPGQLPILMKDGPAETRISLENVDLDMEKDSDISPTLLEPDNRASMRAPSPRSSLRASSSRNSMRPPSPTGSLQLPNPNPRASMAPSISLASMPSINPQASMVPSNSIGSMQVPDRRASMMPPSPTGAMQAANPRASMTPPSTSIGSMQAPNPRSSMLPPSPTNIQATDPRASMMVPPSPTGSMYAAHPRLSMLPPLPPSRPTSAYAPSLRGSMYAAGPRGSIFAPQPSPLSGGANDDSLAEIFEVDRGLAVVSGRTPGTEEDLVDIFNQAPHE